MKTTGVIQVERFNFKDMTSTLKIINAILILATMFISIRAGWSMLTGKPEMVELFGNWGVGKPAIMVFALSTIIGALLLLHPKTYVWGNYLMMIVILFLVVNYIHEHNWKGVWQEVPSFALSVAILYLEHPLSRTLAS